MAEQLITRAAADAHVREYCPSAVNVRAIDDRVDFLVCGCGRCPKPDPTPEEFRRQVEDAIWRSVADEPRPEPLSGAALNAGWWTRDRVEAYSDTFRLQQVLDDLAMRVFGG